MGVDREGAAGGGAPIPITEDDQGSAIAGMKRVVEHFREAADLHEYGLRCEPATR
jgi:hypothetical protein